MEHPLLSSTCFVGWAPACGVDTVLSSCSNYWRQVKQKLWTAALRVHCLLNNRHPETLGPCAPKNSVLFTLANATYVKIELFGEPDLCFRFFSFPVYQKMKDQYLLSILGRTTHSFSHSFFLLLPLLLKNMSLQYIFTMKRI